MSEPFNGAKLAILVSDQIVTILRDDIPTIPWPGHWDLPGGARDGAESPQACVLRELHEELGLALPPDSLTYSSLCGFSDETVWFFATEQPDFDPNDVVFGDEGQRWELAPIDWYLLQPKAIPHHCKQLIRYLESR